jgi:hypothetical protein
MYDDLAADNHAPEPEPVPAPVAEPEPEYDWIQPLPFRTSFCTAWTECTEREWQTRAPGPGRDRRCRAHTYCDFGSGGDNATEFIGINATATTDLVCWPLSDCGQRGATHILATNWTDRVCRCDDEHWYDRGGPPSGEDGEPWDGARETPLFHHKNDQFTKTGSGQTQNSNGNADSSGVFPAGIVRVRDRLPVLEEPFETEKCIPLPPIAEVTLSTSMLISGKKTRRLFAMPFDSSLQMISLCQDRLGTNIGKGLKKRDSFLQDTSTRTTSRRRSVRKTSSLRHFELNIERLPRQARDKHRKC